MADFWVEEGHVVTERSAWTHTLCDTCWALLNPGHEPPRVLTMNPGPSGAGGEDICCQCGAQNCRGIYIREDPRNFACQGRHAA
jgi:hypothetical protein